MFPKISHPPTIHMTFFGNRVSADTIKFRIKSHWIRMGPNLRTSALTQRGKVRQTQRKRHWCRHTRGKMAMSKTKPDWICTDTNLENTGLPLTTRSWKTQGKILALNIHKKHSSIFILDC